MGKTRRKKNQTHALQEVDTLPSVPKSFVMERGKVGHTLSQLVLDIRQVLEPFTASKLKVRQRNVLKDFVSIAGPLGVTHFVTVSRTDQFVNLRMCRLPRGPTLTFHIHAFTLTREVLSSLKKPFTTPSQFLTPALLVLNNFSMEDKPSKLMAAMLQNMFPSINIQSVQLATIKRCVLFHYNPSTKTIEFRHYNIRAIPRGTSRGVRKLVRSQVPNLSKYQDISDYVLGGNVSESEGEEMGGEGEVTLPQNLPGRGNVKAEQSAIRLTELGPRLTLQLVKIESGLCEGEVLHHEFIHKTKREARETQRRVEERRHLKETRRRQQEANILRKKKEKELHKKRCLAGQKSKETINQQDSDESEDDDTEWYRQEVGEEPDPDMFVPGRGPRKRKAKTSKKFSPKAKKQKLKDRRDQLFTAKGGRKKDAKKGGSGQEGARPLVTLMSKKKQGRTQTSRRIPQRRKVAAGKVFRRRAKAT